MRYDMTTDLIAGKRGVAFEPTEEWLRGIFAGHIIADSWPAHLLLPGGPQVD